MARLVNLEQLQKDYANIIFEQFKYITRSEISEQQLRKLADKTANLIIIGEK